VDRLVAEGVCAFRGERLVLNDVSFAVPGGGALVLLGANGSGKSTLLRVLAGLGRIEAGRVLWDGAERHDEGTAPVAYLGHQDAIKPGLTTAENLRFAARAGGDDAGGIARALAAMGLDDLAALPARMLSAGQRRRLALARLALSHAPLWLLDEPTLGLDGASIERFGALLGAHLAAGGVVVAATHVALPLANAAELRLS
jgi:heme exporter protein A